MNDEPLPLRRSLRGRALAATLALLAYLLGAGLYIASEREKIYDSMLSLEALSRHEKAVALAEAAVSGALLDVNEASTGAVPDPVPPTDLRLYMENCTKLFDALEEFDARYATLQRAIARSYDGLLAQPVRANWIELRESLARAADELEIRRRDLAAQRDALNTSYHRQYDAVTVESLVLAALGLGAFGSLAAWFFARLARDIRRLEAHAGQIVRGARGLALDVRREDELGRLMHAVNRMAVDLDEREQQIRLEGERRSHQDKMLAVGALAAGVAHEVNNPLAVISGVAQELRDRESPPDAARVAQGAELILSQAERAGQAARRLAEVAAPQPADLDWVDVNGVLGRVVQLMGYDRRYRRLAIEIEPDRSLPAVRSSASAVQQVLMQLLGLIGDALVAQDATGEPLRVASAAEGTGVALHLRFARALDFTQPEVQRSLLLSRAMVEPLRGRLAFGQDDGRSQRIKLTLPADGGPTGG